MKIITKLSLMFLVLTSSLTAQAHTGLGSDHYVWDGFLHPFIGLEHAWLVLAVGIWSVPLGANATRILPLVYLIAMTFGACAYWFGIQSANPVLWNLIAISLLTMALLASKQLTFSIAVVITAASATTQGLVHASEMQGHPIGYLFGLLLATACIQLLAFGIARLSLLQLKSLRLGFALFGIVLGTFILQGI